MGYYTRYYTVSLFAVKKDERFLFDEEAKRGKAINIFRWINKVRKEDDAKFYPFEEDIDDAVREFFDNPNGFSKEFCLESYRVKWYYDWKREMKDLSRAFPDLVFKVHGCGEENGDVWDAYFCAGEMQDCKAVLEPFDPTKFGGKSPVAVSENSLYLKDFLKTFSYNGELVSIVPEKKNIFDYEVFRYHNMENAIEKFGDYTVEAWTISHNWAGITLKVTVKKGEI